MLFFHNEISFPKCSVAIKVSSSISAVTIIWLLWMILVGADELSVSGVVNFVLNHKSIVWFWNWWQALSGQMSCIILLRNKLCSFALDLHSYFFCFFVCHFRIEGGFLDCCNEFGSIAACENCFFLYFVYRSDNTLIFFNLPWWINF